MSAALNTPHGVPIQLRICLGVPCGRPLGGNRAGLQPALPASLANGTLEFVKGGTGWPMPYFFERGRMKRRVVGALGRPSVGGHHWTSPEPRSSKHSESAKREC